MMPSNLRVGVNVFDSVRGLLTLLPYPVLTALNRQSHNENCWTGGGDGNAMVWNLQGNRLATLTGHEYLVSAVRFSPDGRYILTGDTSTVRLWNLQGQAIAAFKATDEESDTRRITDVQFSPDGKSVAAGVTDFTGDNKLLLWDLQGNQLAAFNPRHGITTIQFNSDGTYIGAFDENLENLNSLWQVQGNQLAVLPDQGALYALKFSPNGDRIATLEATYGTVHLWDLQGNPLTTFLRGHQGHIARVEFSPDGDRILTSSDHDNTVRVWDLDGNQLSVLQGHWKAWESIISPDGKYTITLDGSKIRVWDLEGKPLATLAESDESFVYPPATIQFNPNSNQIATTCGNAGTAICLWNLQGRQLARFQSNPPASIQNLYFNSSGDRIISVSDGVVRLWDLQGNQLAIPEDVSKMNAAFAFIPESDRLVTLSNDNATMFDLQESQFTTIRGREGWFPSWLEPGSIGQFSARGDRIAITGAECKVRVWDLDGNQRAEYDEGCLVSLSPDGKQIMLVSSSNSPTLWRVDDLDGLLQRGCDWLKTYLTVGSVTDTDRQMCDVNIDP